ncbi:MAG: hypothetical protein WA771_05205 [Chthoniobacterales bacterium]
MRALNKNERTLALALGGAVFLIANLMLFQWATRQMRENRAELAAARAEIGTAELLIAERPSWEALSRWIEQHPVETYAGSESNLAFAESVQRSVEAAGLSIESQSLREAEMEGDLVMAGLELDVRGPLAAMVKWLNDLQTPGSYVGIEKFTLKRADATSTMRLQLQVSKVFREVQVAQVP